METVSKLTPRAASVMRRAMSVAGLLIATLVASAAVRAQPLTWVAQAPGPNTKGQVENIDEREVAGAIQTVAAHPTNARVVYVGAVNGGIWRTDNAMDPRPTWQPQTDAHRSLSVGALEFDPTDATGQTLVAGMGRYSSLAGRGGARAGLLRTTNGGALWTPIDGGGLLSGLNVSGVAPRGATIVISANNADNPARVGVWRSTDTGSTWTQISGRPGSGLPAGWSADLAGDPSNPNRLFTNAGTLGLFRSTDAGQTWTRVSNAAMNALIASARNVKISVGAANNPYVAVVVAGVLAGVFRSGDGGATWAAMDLPSNAEGGIHPGEQGVIHLSLTADRGNAQIVYIGGDRQDDGPIRFPAPNSIGARDYTGRLFRGDASQPAGRQWVHLTHSRTLGAAGGGTASGSAPHADSRDMAMAANGVLIEADDGGVYRRTDPRTNAGDWFSMNGNLQATEFHAVAWDSNAKVVIGGSQDTGTPEQQLRSGVRWRSVSTGDGGVVAVDDTGTPGRSVRYSSFQFLSRFRRQVFDANNVLQMEVPVLLQVIEGGNPVNPHFYTPIRLNAVTPTRMIIGAETSVYESTDQGDTLIEIAAIGVNDSGPDIIAYGAAGNPNVLYVGSGSQVFVREKADPEPLTRSVTYPGTAAIVGVAVNPGAPRTAFAADERRVFRTTDAGGAWAEITGNLPTLSPGALHTIAYATSTPAGAVVVGGSLGVFEAPGPAFNNWRRLGTGLPTAPVYYLEYDPTDRILLAATLGRGAWTLTFPAPPIPPPAAGAPASAAETTDPAANAAQPPRQPAPTRPQSPAERRAANASSIQLRPGVVINPARGVAYIMSPAGKIEAVDLRGGKTIWGSPAAAKPLATAPGDRLLGQAEASDAGDKLRIVVLDAATGREMAAGEETLPRGIKSSVVGTPAGQFSVVLRGAEGGNPIVSWEFVRRHKRGAHPDTEDTLAPPGTDSVQPFSNEQVQSGAFRLDLSTGNMSPVAGPGPTALIGMQERTLPAAERLPGLSDKQVLSADGRYVLVSERADDDRAVEKYRLTVYERNTGTRVGEFRSHVAVVPFFVTESSVIYERPALLRRVGAEVVEEPLALRAVDLKTGRELWARAVRDTSFRGPFPP